MRTWLSRRCCWRDWTAFRIGSIPGEPLEKDIYDLSPEELKDVPTLPGSLDEALKALEDDHDFLLKGDVFSPQLIERWITYKREKEIQPLTNASAPARVWTVLRHLERSVVVTKICQSDQVITHCRSKRVVTLHFPFFIRVATHSARVS